MDINLNKLLDEVESEIKVLLKTAQEQEDLNKADDDDKEESKKEESKKEESKKEKSKKEKSEVEKAEDDLDADKEGSGYESQAPEASDSNKEMENQDQEAMPQEDENVEDIADMLKGLDDDMLHELYQRIKMELMERMEAKGAAQEAAQEAALPKEEPAMAMKSEKSFANTLAKKDKEIDSLKKTLKEYEKGLEEFTNIVKMLIDRPVVRAVTDIQYVSKGDNSLKKAEGMSDEEIKKAVDALTSDRSRLASLTKSELRDIADFYNGDKKVKDRIIKIVNK